MGKKSLRDRVEKKLGHSQFRLVYKGAKEWNIIKTGGRDLGYIIDCWPYPIHIKKKYSGFIDWVLGIDIE